MADIKKREVVKGTVKTIDKVAIASERMKSNAIKTKWGASDKSSDDSPQAFAIDKAKNAASIASQEAARKSNAIGKRSVTETKNKILVGRREREHVRSVTDATEKSVDSGQTKRGTIFTASKQAQKTQKNQIRNTEMKIANSKETEKKSKKSVQAFLKSIRKIASEIKTLVIGLTATGWIAAIMIIVTIFVGGTFNQIDVLSVDPNQPGMDDWDKKYLEEILEEYPNAYIGPGDGNIVHVAMSQIGNVGGRRYWYWYGFKSRVEWCACFVSWCADQCGYIKAGIIPKFAGVAQGVNWFRKKNQWHGRNYRPRAGDIIFFTWFPYNEISHVGIVKSCDGKTIYSIEGNSHDRCREKSYSIGARCIYGYGSPAYGKVKVDKETKKEADKA